MRMPRSFVKREAELCDAGPWMGERAKGREAAAISAGVWWSMKVRVVRPVPPEMEEVLGEVRSADVEDRWELLTYTSSWDRMTLLTGAESSFRMRDTRDHMTRSGGADSIPF